MKKNISSRFLWLSILIINLLLANACRNVTPQIKQYTTALDYPIEKEVIAEKAMVVSAHPLASEVGVAILRQGGNAIDATIAIQFALAVVYPRAGNIGGGGLMVIRNADGSTDALDYREKAPSAASRDMYLDSLGNVREGLSVAGHLASGVPGTVAGMWAAHQKYGTLKWKDLIEPAIQLARNGFLLTESEVSRLNSGKSTFEKYSTQTNAFTNRDTFLLDDKFIQTELAFTLERIAQNGKDGFYKGETADLIVAEMKRGNGIISLNDLESYEVAWRKPVEATYKQYKVISMPPPSSGGIAIIQMLKMIEDYPLKDYGFHTAESVHLMAEVERRAFADRAEYLGDPDFYNVPVEKLLDKNYLKQRMSNYHETLPTPSDSIVNAFELQTESFETTHTSVVDAMGNAVAVTTTLNSNFGNKVVVGGAGFFLNNEMDDFSVKPGVPNQFGLVGAEANAIQPQKRMLSSMTPTILEKDGKWFMVLGAPGGSTIITAVFQTIVNVIEFDMPLYQAVQAGRFHHQWKPDEIWIEGDQFPVAVRETLEQRGYIFRDLKRMAVIKAIQQLPDGKLVGVGDTRNPDDTAMGY